jgi:hypothetical protein
MTSIIQDIQSVLALRKTIREPDVPVSIRASIESIHHSLSNHGDQNGWKTVDWRGNSGGGRSNPSSHSRQGGNGSSYHRSYTNRDSASHSNFGNRSRVEAPSNTVSIPLTASATPSQASSIVSTPHVAAPPKHHSWQDNGDGFRHPPQKYVSKFKKSSEKVEDTILNTILLGKLNKFSQPNYNEIKEFITHIIDSGQTEMIKCFMKLVFEKAASEEVFCPLYAKLLSELSIQYPVLLTEMANLYTQYMEIFDEVTEDITSETYNELCKRNVEKKYRRGYSQFLAELIKHDVIDAETFMKSIIKIISQVEANRTRSDSIKLNEEFADCLMKIMKAIWSDVVVCSDDESESKIRDIRTTLKEEIAKRIQPLSVRTIEAVGLSNKARFTFLDIYEGIQKI